MKLDWFEIPELGEDDSYKGLSFFEEENGDKNEFHLFCILDKDENHVEYNDSYSENESDDDLLEFYGY